MNHNRKLGLLAVDLVKVRTGKNVIPALANARDQLEHAIEESNWLGTAPFTWVTLSIRHGLRMEREPREEQINQRYGDLPLSIEVDVNLVLERKDDIVELTSFYREVAARVLISTSKKWGLDTIALQKELA